MLHLLPEPVRVAARDPRQTLPVPRGHLLHAPHLGPGREGVAVAPAHVGQVHAQHPEEPPALAGGEVGQERSGRLVGLRGVAAVVVIAAVVAVPAKLVDGIVNLNKADALLKQAAAQEQHAAVQGLVLVGVVDLVPGLVAGDADGVRLGGLAVGDPKIRAELERFCTDRFEQMKKSSDIKECMSKP